MNDINKLFFELIRVAIGNQVCLSHTPSADEWGELYAIAKKQSLVGICFAGVQRLQKQRQCPPEGLYLQWMGMVAKIQQRNEVLNRQCAELGERLQVKGYRYAILKGQGIASLYKVKSEGLTVNDLSALRQSGDIDVLMWKDGLSLKENRKAVMAFARGLDSEASGSEHHVHAHIFPDTEVELHFEPSYFCYPWANRRFRQWCEEHREDMVWCEELGCMIPNTEYNIVFLLSHIFRHYVSEGVGMRQMMDYYFVLQAKVKVDRLKVNDDLLSLLDSFNMKKFVSAVMWVLGKVFGMDHEYMICEPNERLGKKLLEHIMQGGNFGHHNEVKVVKSGAHWANFVNQLVHDLHLAIDYPSEALWSPLSMIREFLRIRV